ncbi:MAG: M24 family metallopeptidase [Roseibium sp.]|uniref:M24 family metallopeptidase n=1 Tax=Roseibium sp. TaxID=1936156 RepID=UPI001B16CF80|nr:M24 family metallopeptidase [Roseibium sp.]MBO6895436.1 M24 family metallopeptidase [Roseibium sp.]MBO6929984.1 M24 family metallopeptidase [Roseibium sp.]
MPGQNLPFSGTEYERRLALVRSEMARRGIDVLFVEDPSNMAWITGYDGWSFYVHQGVLVFMDEDPVWWGRKQDSNGAKRTVWMQDDQVAFYADNFVQSTERHPMQDLASLLISKRHETNRIGVELENYYFSAKAYLTIKESLPNAEMIDATSLVNWLRAVKSEEEVAFMRKAARISEKIVDGITERAHVGMRKADLVADIYSDAIRGTVDAWGDYPAIVPLLPSGADASAPHLTWDGRTLQSDEATFFEISGCYRRYHAPLCRTVFFGKPPQYLLDAEKALLEGLEAGLEAARAGNVAGDIARALAAPLTAAGIERGARAGYPIGISYPPDWGERTISIRDEDQTVLEAGMTFHFMPGLWMDGWGLEITESILIRPQGAAECLCDRPRGLIVKD